MSLAEDLTSAVKEGHIDESANLVEKILAQGTSASEVLDVLTGAIREVGDAFERFDIFLPEMMMAADAMIEVMKVLDPALKEEGKGTIESTAKIVLASVKGDIHEIGKNIVITMLTANGYAIFDMGADVDSLEIVKTAEREKAAVIGLSALMTTTMPGQKEVIDILNDMGLRDRFKVIIGGSPTSQEWAREIGADGWAKDASEAVKVVEKLISES
jgi:corrinoid protein of di/trimethylamine methyltransferase